jgi:CheY-like chemotaxis protein
MGDHHGWRPGSAPADETPAILLVDDEATVLDTLNHQLRRDYKIVIAPDGPGALAVLDRHGPFAAVVSDMRMPNMDGIELLGRIRERCPDTTRILHTARADVTSAIAAINDGQVFRFLRKPAPTNEIRRTVRDAVERHRLRLAERHVLDKTLRGSLHALFGCLELASPLAFARAARIRDLVGTLCEELELTNVWEIEVAAMASQLGAVTLPPSVLEKIDRGLTLQPDEQLMLEGVPEVATRLLRDVPMLDDVVGIVQGLRPAPRSGMRRAAPPAPPLVATGINVLRAAIEFETFESRGVAPQSAVAILERAEDHDAGVLAALRRVRPATTGPETIRAYRIGELADGMRIAEDVVAPNGLILIGRGMVVTEVLLERLVNFQRKGQLAEPILAVVPTAHPVAG